MWKLHLKKFFLKFTFLINFIKTIPLWVMVLIGSSFLAIAIYGIIEFLIQISG